MLRQRLLHVLAYLPLIVLALSAIVTMTQVGCSGTSTGGYGYGFSGSSGSNGFSGDTISVSIVRYRGYTRTSIEA